MERLQMTEIFIYFGLDFIATLVIASILFFGIIGTCLLINGIKEISDDMFANIIILSTVLCLLIASPLSSYALARYWSYYPPAPKQDIQKQADAAQSDLIKLEAKANTLRSLLNDPKKLTLSQVEQVLTDTLDFVEKLKAKTEQQGVLIASLRQTVVEERAKAEESRRLAEQVQSLTREQLEAVKLLITQDAKVESQRSFIMGISISFPLGILSSLLATWVYKRWGEKAKETIAHEVNK
jgi:hypothetical protein